MGKKKNRIVYKEEDLTPTNGCCLPIRGELCGFCRGTWHWFWTEFAAIIRRDELTDDEHDDADVEVLELRNVLPQGLLPLEERMYHWRCVGLHQPSETPSPNIEQRQPSVHPPGIRIISQQPDRIHFLQSFIDQSNELERSPASAVRKPLPNIQDLRVSPDLPGNRNMRRRRLWLPIPKKAFHDKTPAELKDAKLSNVIAERLLLIQPTRIPSRRNPINNPIPTISVSTESPCPRSSTDQLSEEHSSIVSTISMGSNDCFYPSTDQLLTHSSKEPPSSAPPHIGPTNNQLNTSSVPPIQTASERNFRSRSCSPKFPFKMPSMHSLPERQSPGESSLQETDVGSLGSGTLSFADDGGEPQIPFGSRSITERRRSFAQQHEIPIAIDKPPVESPKQQTVRVKANSYNGAEDSDAQKAYRRNKQPLPLREDSTTAFLANLHEEVHRLVTDVPAVEERPVVRQILQRNPVHLSLPNEPTTSRHIASPNQSPKSASVDSPPSTNNTNTKDQKGRNARSKRSASPFTPRRRLSDSVPTPTTSSMCSSIDDDNVFMQPLPSFVSSTRNSPVAFGNALESMVARSIISSTSVSTTAAPNPAAISEALGRSQVVRLASPQDMELSSSTTDDNQVTVVPRADSPSDDMDME